MARPFAVPITLTDADREMLLGWSRRPKTAQALALRARIVLAAAEPDLTNTALELAEALGNVSETCRRKGISRQSFYEYKRRFAEAGLEGLRDLPPIASSTAGATSSSERSAG